MILMIILRNFWLRVVFLVRGKAFVMGGFVLVLLERIARADLFKCYPIKVLKEPQWLP
jgi:hypothetical protein